MPVVQKVSDPLQDNNKYEKVKDLNSGSFGFVQHARNKHTGEDVAIKFIERTENVSLSTLCIDSAFLLKYRCAELNAF